MKNYSLTEAALNFLCLRKPTEFDISQSEWVFLLMNFQDKKGDNALISLAGFYVYAIDKIGGLKASEAIASTFAHDLNGANDPTNLPRSHSYASFWEQEHNHSYYYNRQNT